MLNVGLIELGDGVFCHVYSHKHIQLVVPTVKRIVRLLPAFCKMTNVFAKLRTSYRNAAIAFLSSHAILALPCSSAR